MPPIRTSALTHAQITAQYHGISRNMIRHVMLNQFTIPRDYHDCMYLRRLRTMRGARFYAGLTDGTIYDPYTLHRYQVIYQDCNPYSVKRAQEVLCSFRVADPELNLEPVVIVRIYTDHEGTLS